MWDEVPGADGYRIYRRRKGISKWTKLGDIEFSRGCITQTKLLFPKQSMIMQSAHTVSLAAKFLWDDYSSTGYVCQTAIPKASLTSVTEQDGGVTVKWNTSLMSPATLFIVQTIRQ